MEAIDLHVHSNRSDGTFSPSQLVDYAMEKGLKAFALTDHDTIDGLEEAVQYGEFLKNTFEKEGHAPASGKGAVTAKRSSRPGNHKVPEIIPGVEFSTEYQGQDVHIVGLYIDYRQEAFQRYLKEFVDSRIHRNRKMCALLQEVGIPVTYEALLSDFPDAVITRAHYAKYMLSHGYTLTMAEAFDRYIGDHCPCYVPREKVTPLQAVDLIKKAGGVPILAHPVLYHMSDSRLDTLTAQLKDAGLAGLEAIYSTYNAAEERQMRTLAAKYDLLISGGSDFHGANKPGLDLGNGYGRLFVPSSLLDDIKKAAGR